MKGTSPPRASGEVFTASFSDAKMEIPVNINIHMRGEVMNKITTVALPETTVSATGNDLAKTVFALHGLNGIGKPVLVRPSVRREGVTGSESN